MKIKQILSSVFLVLVFIAAMAAAGVGCSVTPGYSIATASLHDIRFSYEYPPVYTFKQTSNTPDALGYDITGVYTAGDELNGKEINIMARTPTADLPNAQAWADKYASTFQQSSDKILDFQISPGQVAGIDCSSIYYKYLTDSPEPALKACLWLVMFDYRGYIWNIAVAGSESMAEEAKADFDHLIESFKFLN
jgi:hypothetical protein